MIPRIIHMIWLDTSLPGWVQDNVDRMASVNTRWTVRVHQTSAELHSAFEEWWDRTPMTCVRSDLLRYSILRKYGGVYVDTDVWAIHPLSLTAGLSDLGDRLMVAPIMDRGLVAGCNNWFLACQPDAAVWHEIWQSIMDTRELDRPTGFGAALLMDLALMRPFLIRVAPPEQFSSGVCKDRELYGRSTTGPQILAHYYAGGKEPKKV